MPMPNNDYHLCRKTFNSKLNRIQRPSETHKMLKAMGGPSPSFIQTASKSNWQKAQKKNAKIFES